MSQTKRITLTLNPRQVADAQVIAALEVIGGSASIAIVAFALRGIMSDPAMSATLTKAVALVTKARVRNGNGWKPGNLPVVVAQSAVVPIKNAEAIEFIQLTTVPEIQNIEKTRIIVRKGDPRSTSDFLNW